MREALDLLEPGAVGRRYVDPLQREYCMLTAHSDGDLHARRARTMSAVVKAVRDLLEQRKVPTDDRSARETV